MKHKPKEPVTITAAAIKCVLGEVYSVPKPGRHHDVIRHMSSTLGVSPHGGEQGFVLSTGSFIDRKMAAKIALKNGQCKKLISPPQLFSEDLW